MITADDLRTVPIFEGLPDEALDWLAGHCEEVTLTSGQLYIKSGTPADRMVILLDGLLQAEGARSDEIYLSHAGEVGGMLPHSRMTTFTWALRAVRASRVAELRTVDFPEMLARIPELDNRLIALMADRIRLFTQLRQQRDRLSALGTMAAGLAHELNNPPSAARRAAQELSDTLSAFDRHATRMLKTVMFKARPEGDDDPFQPIYDTLTVEGVDLSPLVRSDLEDELAEWLDDQGVDEP